MHSGSSSSAATLIITAAGLAMLATVFAQAELEKKKNQQQHPDEADGAAARLVHRRTTIERQLSTASRSKRDRIDYGNEDEAENEANLNNDKNKPPPIISIGVPTKIASTSRVEEEHHAATSSSSVARDGPPVGVDVSFASSSNTDASALSVVECEEASSCDDDSTQLLLAAQAAGLTVDDDDAVNKEMRNRAGRERMSTMTSAKAFIMLALLWALAVFWAPVWVGTKSIADVHSSWEDVATQYQSVVAASTATVSSYWTKAYEEYYWIMDASQKQEETELPMTPMTRGRAIKGAFGPFIQV